MPTNGFESEFTKLSGAAINDEALLRGENESNTRTDGLKRKGFTAWKRLKRNGFNPKRDTTDWTQLDACTGRGENTSCFCSEGHRRRARDARRSAASHAIDRSARLG
jgi:hypothetical protein